MNAISSRPHWVSEYVRVSYNVITVITVPIMSRGIPLSSIAGKITSSDDLHEFTLAKNRLPQ